MSKKANLEAARARHVDIIEMRRNGRVAELGIWRRCRYAPRRFRIVFVVGKFQRRAEPTADHQIGGAD